ncbi:MAG: hypothetical protein K6D02_06010 [Lachnospiraceae bacterium]|nr:hypothetical protein [Lachnospiraceae bacterium]
MRRIIAIIGVVILLGLYITTFIVAITSTKDTMTWLYTSISATVIVSVIMYALNMYAKNMQKKEAEEADRALKFKNAMEDMIKNRKKEEEKRKAEEASAVAYADEDASAGATGSDIDTEEIEREARIKTLKSLVDTGALPLEKAAEAANMTVDEFNEITDRLA